MTVELAALLGWLGQLLWALARVCGLLLTVPVFGAQVIPMRVKLGLAVVLALVLAPLAPVSINVLSAAGLLDLASQIAVGAAAGFVLKMVFEAVAYGGALVGQGMSLGFAEVADPQGGARSNVLGQFYMVLVTLLFLALDGHLRLVELLAESFHHLPPGQPPLGSNGLFALVSFGTELFGGAVRVALPAMTALLLVNIGFAAISRAAPSMNLFAVGFPITVCLGFVAVWLALRSLPGAFNAILDNGWGLMRQLLGG